MPVKCAVTAGRDSRTVLALCIGAGVDSPPTGTIGPPDDVDVIIGRQVADYLGLEHTLNQPLQSAMLDDLPTVIPTFISITDGLASLSQIQDIHDLYDERDRVGVLVWGMGGEIARSGVGPITKFAANGPLISHSAAFQAFMLRAKIRDQAGVLKPDAGAEAKEYVDPLREGAPGRGLAPGPGRGGLLHLRADRTLGLGGLPPRHRSRRPLRALLHARVRELRLPHEPRRALRRGGTPPHPHPPRPGVAGSPVRHALARRASAPGPRAVDRGPDRVHGRAAGLGERLKRSHTRGPEGPPLYAYQWLERHRDAHREVCLSDPSSPLFEWVDRAALERAFTIPTYDEATALGVLRVVTLTHYHEHVRSSGRVAAASV